MRRIRARSPFSCGTSLTGDFPLAVTLLQRVVKKLRFCGSLLVLALIGTKAAWSETLLERIIPLIQEIENVHFESIHANIAENAPTGLMDTSRTLAPGDQVIVGYDANGQPNFLTVGLDGLYITEQDTLNHVRGLPPGYYPIGSMLFQLEPGAQLSLYNSDADGQMLELARELIFAGIDGRITSHITGAVLQDLTDLMAAQVNYDEAFDIGEVQSTVLGAVNTGQIVTNVTVDYRPDLDAAQINIPPSSIFTGHSGELQTAINSGTFAVQSAHVATGGSAEAAVIGINIATNTSEVTGAVLTRIQSRSASIQNLVTTAIGAVNGGIVYADR